MDEADIASRSAEELLNRQIAAQRMARLEAEATGSCLNCGERLPDGVRWCDHDCMSDWQKRRR